MRSGIARAYWATGSLGGELREEPLPSDPASDRLLVRTEWSGISVGTERVVGRGLVPTEAWARMGCPHMAGSFAFPVKYGYSAVGVVEAGPRGGERVFVLHPHQDWMVASPEWATILPASVPARRGVLVANLETALNAVWEAEPAIAAKPIVVGGGALGLLVAYAIHSETGLRPCLVETDPVRRRLAEALPWVRAAIVPEEVATADFDVAWHTSATAEGLDLALRSVGFEGRVIELSWYGAKSIALDLGSHFHFDRKPLIASQVGAVAPSPRGRTTPAERRDAAVRLLMDDQLDRLLSSPIPFDSLPTAMARLYGGADLGIVPLIAYRGN